MIVVTGASGFIGRAAVEALAGRNIPVLAASRSPLCIASETVCVNSYAELVPPAVDSVLLHLAEPRNISAAERQGNSYVDERRAALSDLLAKKWDYVVYASSAVVYGDASDKAHRADERPTPHGVYAKAKAACERDVLAHGGAVARISNVYGSGMADDNVISDILRQIHGSGPLIVRDRKPVRDYLWIDDASKGLAALALSRKAGIFNFGSGHGLSVGDLARLALDRAGQPRRPVHASMSEHDSHLVLDVSETEKKLGWRPSVSLEQGLGKLLGAALS